MKIDLFKKIMENRRIYISPKLTVEEVHFEDGIANGSTLVKPGNETGVILINDWIETTEVESQEEDSRW